MHLITDEHGNPIPHSGHEHDEHEHLHGDHDHSHEHSHGEMTHSHEHSHESENIKEMSQTDRNRIMLDYMIDHNAHHIQEMEDLARKLELAGNKDAAENIRLAKDLFSQGNQLLGEVEI